MFEYSYLAGEPLFYLFIAFSFILGAGYFWGKRVNTRIFRSAFDDLVSVIQPTDQTFTNIGGLIGYHANLTLPRKSPVERVDATITFLPRHSWLWMPISKLIRKYDRLFITLHLRQVPGAEGHLIEKDYSRFRGPKIDNADRMKQEVLTWGKHSFLLYYGNGKIRDQLRTLASDTPDPGNIRHIAIVPEQKRCFIFMIPREGQVAKDFGPVYRWLLSQFRQEASR
jgi:hypothetical protein